MQFALLKALSPENARLKFRQGKLTRFDYSLYCYLHDEKAVHRFSGADITRLRRDLSLTQEALSEILDVSKRTILRWENEQDPIPGMANIVLNALWTLQEEFFDLMKPDTVETKPVSVKQSEISPLLLSEFNAATIIDLRERFRMSRAEFAKFLSLSPSTVIKWETGEVQPKGPALALLKILWRDGLGVMP